ncbi:MAG: biotin/lipoate A/B protein ligase family protein [Planctomycetaceae bacterium]
MSRSPTCHVIVDGEPNRGTWNMAFDEALLTAAVEQHLCAVRVYQWSEATVSLGYFQAPESVAAINDLANLPVVRRLSGGGALLHHFEITYSCVVPASHPLATEPAALYPAVHHAIIARLKRHGIEAQLRGSADRLKDAAFLCFGRGDPRDVLVAEHKIVGSAQRRRRGAILQHGSLLLRRSPFAPQFPGVLDLAEEGRLTADELRGHLGFDIAKVLGEPVALDALDADVQRHAASLEETRYRLLDWRGIPLA